MGIKLRLLQSNDEKYFLDCIDELYCTIEKESTEIEVERSFVKASRIKFFLIRKLIEFPSLFKLRPTLKNNHDVNFASMISGDFRLLLSHSLFTDLNFVYMYDVWPRFHKWIFPLLDFFKVKLVFFSSKQVLQDFQQHYPKVKCKAMWIPEGIKADEYCFEKLEHKVIDVLEFGRMYDAYHEKIISGLQANGKNHIYKKTNHEFLFPAKIDFTNALAKSKIVICVPSNITHPDRAEYISSMTLRYLQAMASKCLIVGILPSDMQEVFGYNPLIEIDMDHADTQIITILNHYEDYLPLIEKNYQAVIAHHQWQNRWLIMKEHILKEI